MSSTWTSSGGSGRTNRASEPSCGRAPRGPRRGAVLAEVERAGHRVARDPAGEAIGQRVAVPLGDAARHRDRLAVDRAGDVARDEVALVRAVEARTALAKVDGVDRTARGVGDLAVPAAVEIRGGR